MDISNETAVSEPRPFGKPAQEWHDIAEDFYTELITLSNKYSLTPAQVFYVIAWISAWIAEYVYNKSQEDNSNDVQKTGQPLA